MSSGQIKTPNVVIELALLACFAFFVGLLILIDQARARHDRASDRGRYSRQRCRLVSSLGDARTKCAFPHRCTDLAQVITAGGFQ